ncbi:hypothetical protein CSW59_04000 [Caulobacter sp. BP25]|nr:hypothetical protein CSW59_04000 [Caulobacter sp. BP25]
MGHSNGTALLAGAMTLSPAIRFDRLVFAGSVVRRDYEWKTFLDRGQVDGVMNYVATNDYIVAAFPKFIQWLPYADLGSAGFDGFDGFKPFNGSRANDSKNLEEVKFARGGHGAALREAFWNQAAGFLVRKPVELIVSPTEVSAKRDWPLRLANGILSRTAVPFILFVIGVIGAGILFGLSCVWPCTPAWAVALLFLAYVGIVKMVLTRL